MGGQETCQLPDDPTLAAIARALNDAGYWAIIVDRSWRNLYITDAQRLSEGGLIELAPFPVGVHISSPESLTAWLAGRGRLNTIEAMRKRFEMLGPYQLAAAEGGREELRELVDPRLGDIVDQLSPADLVNALSVVSPGAGASMSVEIQITLIPVRDSDGQLVGTVILTKPAASMAVLAAMAAGGDLRHFERSATPYVGHIITRGRAEVTALGDEVNEGARIEACATGGRVLASKDLLERLESKDAAALGLDADRLTYTSLADLPTANEKARRDAPAIAVCEL